MFHYSLTTDILIFFERLCLPVCLPLLPRGEYTFPYNKYIFGVMFGDLFEGSEQTVLTDSRLKLEYFPHVKIIILGMKLPHSNSFDLEGSPLHQIK